LGQVPFLGELEQLLFRTGTGFFLGELGQFPFYEKWDRFLKPSGCELFS